MRQIFKSLAASAFIVGLACSPSSAAIIGSSSFLFGTGTTTANFAGTATHPFSDVFTLNLLATGDTSIAFNSTYTGSGQPKTKYTTFSLSGNGNTYLPTFLTNSPTVSMGSIFVSGLAAGIYSLTIGGNGVSSGGKFPQYAGTLSVSTVPLPASLPMFGAALLGIGAIGYAMKRKTESKGLVAAV